MTMAEPKLPRTILEISAHLILTCLFSLIIYLKSANLNYVVIFVCGGILIDLDHFLDYCLFFKNRFKLKDFLSHTYIASGKIYLILHSWEINLIVLFLGLILQNRALLILALSLALHLSIDNLQRKNPFAYSLIYRITKRFDVKTIFPEFFTLP